MVNVSHRTVSSQAILYPWQGTRKCSGCLIVKARIWVTYTLSFSALHSEVTRTQYMQKSDQPWSFTPKTRAANKKLRLHQHELRNKSCKSDCSLFHFIYSTDHWWAGMGLLLPCQSTSTIDCSQFDHKWALYLQLRAGRGIPSRHWANHTHLH